MTDRVLSLGNFRRSLALIDSEGKLADWDSGLELEWSAARHLIRRGTPYAEIVRALTTGPAAEAFMMANFRFEDSARHIEARIAGLGTERTHEYRTVDGRTILVEERPTVSGGVQRTARDITREKQGEDQIELLRSVVVQSSDAILIVEIGKPDAAPTSTLYANPTFEQLSGFTLAELAGRSTEMLTVFQAPPEISNEIAAALARGEEGSVEYEAHRRDGTSIWVENRFAVIQRFEDGSSRVVFMLRDIRDRRQRDAELRAAEARYRALFDNAPESIMLIRCEPDGAFVVEAANPALTKTLEEFSENAGKTIVGNTIEEVAAGWAQEAVITDYRICVAERRLVQNEYTSPDGSVVFHATLVPIFDANGRVAQLSATTRDVTEARHREAELRHAKNTAEVASRAKGEFLANMSHELRTPLNAIIGFSELIGQGVERHGWIETYGEYLNDISASGRHLLSLINTILDLSKIEAGMVSLDLDAVDLDELLVTSVALLSGLAQEGGIDLQLGLPTNRAEINGDFVKLRQVMLNVLSNAIKFTPPGGKVAVSASATANGVAIIVADTGCGISEADLQRVARPFVQVENSLSRKHPGTGLGLSIAKQLCELHQGKLVIESEEGKGTTVRITLPQLIGRIEAAALAVRSRRSAAS